MTIMQSLCGIAVLALAAASPVFSTSVGNPPAVPEEMVVSVRPVRGASLPENLQPGDLKITEGRTNLPVTAIERLTGDLAKMQLYVLLDDSTRSSSLGIHLPALKKFVESLPASTEVAVGYMRNGTFAPAQAFTADHHKAAVAVRLPDAVPGENGSPYFALEDLVKHWPSDQAAGRRAVLMLTDGVDRYWGTSIMDDPYEDQAIQGALKKGVMVYSIYLRGAGLYGRSTWVKDFAQSRLMMVSDETGGCAYFEEFSDPVTIQPFLKDLRDRLDHQYRVSFQALSDRGVQPVKLRTESLGLKVEGPTRIYVP